MNNKTKGVIAGIAGIALLGGGTTFALWSDSAGVNGGTITNGNLEVAAIGTLSWVDTSPDRDDAGHVITDIDTWRMVPGDIITGTQGIGVALEGDNLVAALTVETDAVDSLPAGMTVTYRVESGAYVGPETPLGTASQIRLAAGRAGQGAGSPSNPAPTIVIDDTAIPATANVNVVITATFSGAVTGRTSVEAQTILDDINVELAQVRSGADFG